jgi:hypothetical protein
MGLFFLMQIGIDIIGIVMEILKKIGFFICCLMLAACSKPDLLDEAKKNGFKNVEEMKAIRAAGHSTKSGYLISLMPGSGCSSIEELERAINETGEDCNHSQGYRDDVKKDIDSGRNPIIVTKGREYVKNWKQFENYMYIQSTKDGLRIHGMVLNRGRCNYLTVPSYPGNYLIPLNFGEKLKVLLLGGCDLLEATIETNDGEFLLEFR